MMDTLRIASFQKPEIRCNTAGTVAAVITDVSLLQLANQRHRHLLGNGDALHGGSAAHGAFDLEDRIDAHDCLGLTGERSSAFQSCRVKTGYNNALRRRRSLARKRGRQDTFGPPLFEREPVGQGFEAAHPAVRPNCRPSPLASAAFLSQLPQALDECCEHTPRRRGGML